MNYYVGRNHIKLENTVITLGKFDGIHLGHQFIIEESIKSKAQGLISVLFTFVQLSDREYIYDEKEKAQLVEQLGVDYMIVYPFDDITMNMDAIRFVEEVLVKQLGAKRIVVGEDFRFGKGRKGDGALLKELSNKYQFDVDIYEKKCTDINEEISSTLIRNCIVNSEMEKVYQCLGRYYGISGKIIKGNQIGRTMGFPTINIEPKDGKIMPCNGVYESEVVFHDEPSKIYKGVTNIGNKPTIANNLSKNVETHIIDFEEDVYDKYATVYLKGYIRPEMKFASIEELKNTIKKDKDKVIYKR